MSNKKKTKQEVAFRTATFNREAINEEERTIELSFSSEEPYERWTGQHGRYLEVLGHNEDEIDQTFIASGRAPLLADHDPLKQIGVVEAVQLSDGRARALVKVSRSALGTEFLQDIVDGIRSNVSVGYYVIKEKEEGKRDGVKVIRATRWRPIEVSIVSVPADETVGIGRADTAEQDITTNNEGVTEMSEEKKEQEQPTVDVEAVIREAKASEQARVRDINGLGAKFGMAKAAEEFVKNDKSAEEFRAYVLENMTVENKKTEVKAERSDASIGLTDKEVKSYSFLKAIRTQMDPNNAQFRKEAGFELEVSRAAAELRGQDARGIIVPHDVLTRDLTAGGASDGTKVISTDLLAGSFIDLLRNKVVVAQLGATMLSGLRGNVAIPRQTGAGTAYWIATEGNAPTESQQTIDQVALSPKTLGAYTEFTRQLVLQSSIDVETFVRNDLASVLAIAIDLAALYGTNASGQPKGIVNQTGVLKATAGLTEFAAAIPTFAEVVEMETAVLTNNALMGNLSYLMSPSVYGGTKTKALDAGSGRFVNENGMVNGYKAVPSAQVTAGDVFFANWADLLIGMWGGLDITVDPYSLSTSGGVRVVALQSVDVAIRQPKSFAFNNYTP
jgi:HK97 family phage major capsid protein